MTDTPHPLRAYREQHKLTQTQLADALGVTQSVISEIEGGTRFPSADLAFRIEDLTGIPARSIVRRRAE